MGSSLVVGGKVGILGVQGCIEPHEIMLSRIGVESIRVRTPEDLDSIDRLILPGGESTTMLSFIQRQGLFAALRTFAATKPMWGICAGAILLAREVMHPEQPSLGVIDIRAYRNFYGSQVDSFIAEIDVRLVGSPIKVMFIRAPHIEPLSEVNRERPVENLASYDGRSVFLQQGRIWASAFHVELGDDSRLHKHFMEL